MWLPPRLIQYFKELISLTRQAFAVFIYGSKATALTIPKGTQLQNCRTKSTNQAELNIPLQNNSKFQYIRRVAELLLIQLYGALPLSCAALYTTIHIRYHHGLCQMTNQALLHLTIPSSATSDKLIFAVAVKNTLFCIVYNGIYWFL